MTDEELVQTIQELSGEIDKLSETEKTLTKEEERQKYILELKKETLEKIQEAREKNNLNQEYSHTVTYGLLNTFGDKHPFLMHLIKSRFRIGF